MEEKTATEVMLPFYERAYQLEKKARMEHEMRRSSAAIKLSLERGWLPMLDAPRDGRDIIVYSGPDFDPLIGIGHWEEAADVLDLEVEALYPLSEENRVEFLKAGWVIDGWGDYTKNDWPEMWRAIPWPKTGK